jgi:hypothetical protein
VGQAHTQGGKAPEQGPVVLGRGQHKRRHQLANQLGLDLHALVAHHYVHHLCEICAVHLCSSRNRLFVSFLAVPGSDHSKTGYQVANGRRNGQMHISNNCKDANKASIIIPKPYQIPTWFSKTPRAAGR